MFFDEKRKQSIIDIYNRIESWVVGIIFLLFGIWISNIYQSASIAGKEEANSTIFYWVPYIDNFQSLLALIILLLVIFFGYKLKKLPTSNEIELQGKLKEKETTLERITNEKEQLSQFLDEAQRAVTDIRSQNIEDLFSISSQFLRFLFNELGLNHQDRLSIYIHNSERCYFSLIARYSSNTDFCKQHRQTFPDNQGILGEAWRGNGTNGLKVYTLPQTYNSYINKCVKSYHIPVDTAKKFTMRSTRMLPIFILNNQQQIGIFLVESTRKASDGHSIKDNKDGSNEKFSVTVEKHKSYILDLIEMYLAAQNRIEIIQESGDE